MTNQELFDFLVEKGVITSSALAGGGLMNPEQADTFIDYVFDETGLKGKVRTIKFSPEDLIIDKIGVGNRVAIPAEEAADPKLRRGVNTSKVVLHPFEFMVPFEIGDDFKQYNIEGDNVEDHIMRMFAAQFANDIEELELHGDVLGPAVLEGDIIDGGDPNRYVKDLFIGKLDGWLRKADEAHIVDADGENISSGFFSDMINAMPTKFKRNRQNLKFFTAPDLEQNYRQVISTRATGAGDVALSTTQNITPFGIELVPLPLFAFYPKIVQHIQLNDETVVDLRYAPVSEVVVTTSTLNKTPEDAYVDTTDYVVDLDLGQINRVGAGAITNGEVVKVTYRANPQVLLTEYRNLIVGIGRDIRVETDRDIFKRVDQFVMTIKVAVEWEETDAVVKGIDLGDGYTATP